MYKILFLALLFVGHSALADGGTVLAETCYVAKNPSNIEINFVSESGETRITEKAKLAEVKLQSIQYDGMPKAQEEILVKAKSDLMVFNTSAIHFQGIEAGEYAIECDGGRINVSEVDGQMLANSDYLAGEISFKSADEGCNGLGSLSMKNVVLEKLACE